MRWLRALFGRRRTHDEQIRKELQFHLDHQIRDLIAGGLSSEEAQRRARMELGGMLQTTERLRDVRPAAWIDPLAQDARMAVRALRRTPGITLTAVALIALVVGGNTTIFSIVHGLLTKPAPGIEADRLVTFAVVSEGRLLGPEDSYANYLDYAAQSRTVRSLLAYHWDRFTIGTRNASYGVHGVLVSANYFDTLGLRLSAGRPFTAGESRLDASGLVAIVSHRFWQHQLQGAGDVLGQPIRLNGHPATIVGIAPPRFNGATLTEAADVWVPLLSYTRVAGRERMLDDRGAGSPSIMIGQLAPDATIDQARAELATISTRLQQTYPDTNRNRSITVFPYFMLGTGSMAYQGLSRFLTIFGGVAIVTVLIVCANVANLMLARAAARQRDTAVRQSLGASRGRIVRALFVEGLAMSLMAWAAACGFAWWVTRSVVALVGRTNSGALITPDFTPDWQVMAYAMGLAVLSTFAFTLAPALRVWRQDPLPWLRAGEQSVVQGRSLVSSTLVIVQLAFSILLLTCAGLGYRSLLVREARPLGFDKDGLLLLTVNTSDSASDAETHRALVERVRSRLRAVPGVAVVSHARGIPGAFWAPAEARRSAADTPVATISTSAGPDYLRSLGARPVLGRDIDDRPRGGANDPADALITQNLAEALWPGQSALGHTLLLGSQRQPVRVVGVAPNGYYSAVNTETLPRYVFVSRQYERAEPGEATFFIRLAEARGDGSADALAPTIGRALRDVDPRLPIVYLRSMDAQLDSANGIVRYITAMFTLFAVASLLISAIGLYAVVAFNMRRRTRDFGLRVALGASSAQIVRGVIGEGVRLTAVGLAIGFALAVVIGTAARRLLFGVAPTDPSTYLGVLGLLALVSIVACYLPARRAARVDPITALRQE